MFYFILLSTSYTEGSYGSVMYRTHCRVIWSIQPLQPHSICCSFISKYSLFTDKRAEVPWKCRLRLFGLSYSLLRTCWQINIFWLSVLLFWDLMPCGLVARHRRLGEISAYSLQHWRWWQYVSPKRWYLLTSPCGVTIDKTNMDIFTAVGTWNLILWLSRSTVSDISLV
jgi:hypothetical protein